MAKFYFTYGTSRQFPYQGGWTEVEANTEREAICAFRAYHPDHSPHCLNCSDYYTEERFKRTTMYHEGNRGAFCHERITLLRECSEVPDVLRNRSGEGGAAEVPDLKEEKQMPVMRISELRSAAGLTVPQLAAAVGVTAAEVVAWGCETYLPKTRQLPALAKVLGCGIDDLFVGEEIKGGEL